MSKIGLSLAQWWSNIQATLFPLLEEELNPLTEKQQQLITILEVVRIEQHIPDYRWYEGRPQKSRCAIARSFVAKMVYNMDTTRGLRERLQSDKNLRRICGWERKGDLPSEATFSRAFAEFAETGLPQQVHESLVKKAFAETETIVLHNSRDSTAIDARQKPEAEHKTQESQPEKRPAKKRGRPKKGEDVSVKEPTRIERQGTMSLEEMLGDEILSKVVYEIHERFLNSK